ncbi:hypothetical protein B0H14DRAFT_2595743 [Mycena olivaceomarginata]|nr:hypothetical protein B0H14DRAFT_2595743 [Mycena olivaceomarginata]
MVTTVLASHHRLQVLPVAGLPAFILCPPPAAHRPPPAARAAPTARLLLPILSHLKISSYLRHHTALKYLPPVAGLPAFILPLPAARRLRRTYRASTPTYSLQLILFAQTPCCSSLPFPSVHTFPVRSRPPLSSLSVIPSCDQDSIVSQLVLPRLLTPARQVDLVKSTQVELSRVTCMTPTDFGVEPKST